MNDRAAKPFVDYLSFIIEREYRTKGESVFAFDKRANAVREALGEHGDRAIDEIDRGAAFECFFVESRVWSDVV